MFVAWLKKGKNAESIRNELYSESFETKREEFLKKFQSIVVFG